MWLLLALVHGSACGDGTSSTDGDPVTGTSSAPPVVLSIGRDAGVTMGSTPSDEFAGVRGAIFLDRDVLMVADAGNHQIRAHAPDGRRLAQAGGEGQGPGEFRRITDMALGLADSVLVLDPTAGRVSVFDNGATFRRSIDLDSLGARIVGLLGARPDGSLLLLRGLPRQRPTGVPFQDSAAVFRVSPEGDHERTEVTVPLDESIRTIQNGFGVTWKAPFGVRTTVGARGEDLYVLSRSLEVVSLPGGAARTVLEDTFGVPIGPGHRAVFIEDTTAARDSLSAASLRGLPW